MIFRERITIADNYPLAYSSNSTGLCVSVRFTLTNCYLEFPCEF
jgi:hypothetical protein